MLNQLKFTRNLQLSSHDPEKRNYILFYHELAIAISTVITCYKKIFTFPPSPSPGNDNLNKE